MKPGTKTAYFHIKYFLALLQCMGATNIFSRSTYFVHKFQLRSQFVLSLHFFQYIENITFAKANTLFILITPCISITSRLPPRPAAAELSARRSLTADTHLTSVIPDPLISERRERKCSPFGALCFLILLFFAN